MRILYPNNDGMYQGSEKPEGNEYSKIQGNNKDEGTIQKERSLHDDYEGQQSREAEHASTLTEKHRKIYTKKYIENLSAGRMDKNEQEKIVPDPHQHTKTGFRGNEHIRESRDIGGNEIRREVVV